MWIKKVANVGLFAAGLSLAAVSANASTVNISKQESSVFGSNGKASVTITDDVVRPTGLGTQAGGFALTGPGLGDFVAWCLDIGTYLRLSSLYDVTEDSTNFIPFSSTTPVSLGEKSNIQALFDTGYALLDLTSNTDSAGFQLALWELVYEDGPSFDVTNGDFTVTGNSDAQARANQLLAGITGPENLNYTLTFLESDETLSSGAHRSQNLVTADLAPAGAVVPLPSAGFLLFGAMGGLAALRRRKKS